MNKIFPFTAIVNQKDMKLALILNAINPSIGGVLIRGKKGTAKSTAVRALASLLPEIEVVEGCPFNCSPNERQGICQICERGEEAKIIKRPIKIVELPLGTTEDRLVGSIDIEEAIKKGKRVFYPGLLAEAHRGILYIDEVNLLNDHLVDLLLDAAAMGKNYVEREGISVTHESKFILIGTMNPEEGELRPQFLDRFGLVVDVQSELSLEERVEVIKRRIAFEEDPDGFIKSWKGDEEERNRIIRAKELLPKVKVSDDMVKLIAKICSEHKVDGFRADIVIYKTAKTLAAYNGRDEVLLEDILEASRLALPHRLKREPFQSETPKLNFDKILQEGKKNFNDFNEKFEIGEDFKVKEIKLPFPSKSIGKRAKDIDKLGYYISSRIPRGEEFDIALDATLRVAAPYQLQRSKEGRIVIEPWDLREKVRERRAGTNVIFIIDSSGSMAFQRKMKEVKGALLSLLKNSYQKRDRISLICFKGEGAHILLPPTKDYELAQRALRELSTGGKTPLSHGLKLALELVEREKRSLPFLVLVTDGKANRSMYNLNPLEEALNIAYKIKEKGIPSLILDAEDKFLNLGLVKRIATAMGGLYFRLDDLKADGIVNIIKYNMH
ncbi:Magnesium-chelatase 38 kDa subunit [archaeon HR06]|nr:Magnesium-chelatase 38 kDa subunit [archaeon HR06]